MTVDYRKKKFPFYCHVYNQVKNKMRFKDNFKRIIAR